MSCIMFVEEVIPLETINERFRNVRNALGLSQEKFAEEANRTRSEIKNIEYEKTMPSESIIKAVCSAHGVNRRYLEHGEEPMFMPEPDPGTDYINALLENCDSPFVEIIQATMRVYVDLPQSDRLKFDDFARKLRAKLENKDRD